MVCYAVEHNLPQSAEGTSGLRPNCVATSVGSFIGDNTMKKINISTPMYPNTFTLVDDEDYEWLNQWKWHAKRLTRGGLGVARWRLKTDPLGPSAVQMARFIMDPPPGFVVDHIDHDNLDHRRCNLRVCTVSQNAYNAKPISKTSKYKGVSWMRKARKWEANITVEGTCHYLGLFKTEVGAAEAYQNAAERYQGEFMYCPSSKS